MWLRYNQLPYHWHFSKMDKYNCSLLYHIYSIKCTPSNEKCWKGETTKFEISTRGDCSQETLMVIAVTLLCFPLSCRPLWTEQMCKCYLAKNRFSLYCCCFFFLSFFFFSFFFCSFHRQRITILSQVCKQTVAKVRQPCKLCPTCKCELWILMWKMYLSLMIRHSQTR